MLNYIRYLWAKYWTHRKTFGPWMRWSLDSKTKEDLLRNGWAEAHYRCPEHGDVQLASETKFFGHGVAQSYSVCPQCGKPTILVSRCLGNDK